MSKAGTIVGALVATIVIAVAVVLIYAARNLNSIIAERQTDLLARVSDSLDRKVEVSSIKVTIGWGIFADLTGVNVHDDPAISDQPFIEASDVYAKVDILPLLWRRIHVSQVMLKNPEVHIVRTEQGGFNISTIGKRHGDHAAEAPAAPQNSGPGGAAQMPLTSESGNEPKKSRSETLNAIYIANFVVDKGVISYEARGPKPQTVTVKDVDLSVNDFSFTGEFEATLAMAMLSDRQNVNISGSFGPLSQGGAIEIQKTPFKLTAKLGPIELAKLQAFEAIGKAIPGPLALPDPVSLELTAEGVASSATFHVDSDLSADRVAWGNSFIKPASVTFTVSADGSRSESGVELSQANVTLGDLDAKVQRIHFAGGGLSARIDTNRFDIGALAKIVPAMQKYSLGGQVEIHSDVRDTNQQPQANGTVSLTGVALSRQQDQTALISDLTGDIRFDGNRGEAGPLTFGVGGGHATLSVRVRSIRPVDLSYDLGIDRIRLADLEPKRSPDEYLSKVAITGIVAQGRKLSVSATGTASEGSVANVSFTKLNLNATMLGQQIFVRSIDLKAFNGAVSVNGIVTLGEVPSYTLNLAANGVDIQSALQSQKSKSADMIRGVLNSQVRVSGQGTKFEDIKPTLSGQGRAAVHDGKLVGVNVAADALKKANHIPKIGDLMPSSLVQRHPELFKNSDTDINSASLTFVLNGPRITTHDLVVQTPDYSMTGDGWFDMDKNINLMAHLLLTKQFTDEMVAARKEVVFVTNENGQVDIPLQIQGRLPKPIVTPDVGELAQRAGSHLEQEGVDVIGKLLKKGKDKGSNPLDQLKGLFH